MSPNRNANFRLHKQHHDAKKRRPNAKAGGWRHPPAEQSHSNAEQQTEAAIPAFQRDVRPSAQPSTQRRQPPVIEAGGERRPLTKQQPPGTSTDAK